MPVVQRQEVVVRSSRGRVSPEARVVLGKVPQQARAVVEEVVPRDSVAREKPVVMEEVVPHHKVVEVVAATVEVRMVPPVALTVAREETVLVVQEVAPRE